MAFDVPAQSYDAFMGRYSRPLAPLLADLAGVASGQRVLDVGCGTGEHVLMAAALGLDATGVDLAPTALDTARAKARDRGLTARFVPADARALEALGERFDTVLDCGLFHVLDDRDRAAYLASVRAVLAPGGRYLMLCFSDRQPGDQGPRRSGEAELRATLATGWRLDALDRVSLDSPAGAGGVHGWRVTATRT